MVYLVAGALCIVSLIVFKKSGNFMKSFFTSALGGATALCAVSALSYFVPLSVGFNWYSLIFSCLFSVPGVIFLLLSKTFLF